LGLGDLADQLVRGAENAGAAVQEALFEPVIRLGVTGLSRAGKTVFITGLVANLMNRSRMPGFRPAAEGRIEAAFLQPHPDDLVPRFAYEDHLAELTGQTPHWGTPTRQISELRLSFRMAPRGIAGLVTGPRRVHLDIVDYPGEWLLDLGLLDLGYTEWSDLTVKKLSARAEARAFMETAAAHPATERHDEVAAQALAAAYRAYLAEAKEAGLADIAPGRFLLPGDLEGSPALTFAPLAGAANAGRSSLGAEMARRFEAYKAKVIKPFFRDHFARIDRQVVLVDPLSALARGPRALAELETSMAAILGAFRTGTNPFLARLFLGRRIDRILFAATKADRLHSDQHGALAALTTALLRSASDRAAYSGAETRAMAIAALRTTTQEAREGVGMVLGRIEEAERPVAIYPGTLPAAPGDLLAAARAGAESWPGGGFEAPKFLPRPLNLGPGEGLPHIRLDLAADYLLGDRL